MHWTSECANENGEISCAQSLSSMAKEVHADIVGSIEVSNTEPLLGSQEDEYLQATGNDPNITIFVRNGFASLKNSAGEIGWTIAEIQPKGLVAGNTKYEL